MKDESETNASTTEAAPAAPKPALSPRPSRATLTFAPRTRTMTATIPTAIAAPSASRCSKPTPGVKVAKRAPFQKDCPGCRGRLAQGIDAWQQKNLISC